MNPKTYLEAEGMLFGIPFDELHERILDIFGDRAPEFVELNELVALGEITGSDELYQLPNNKKESAGLFSVDRQRYLNNFRYLSKLGCEPILFIDLLL